MGGMGVKPGPTLAGLRRQPLPRSCLQAVAQASQAGPQALATNLPVFHLHLTCACGSRGGQGTQKRVIRSWRCPLHARGPSLAATAALARSAFPATAEGFRISRRLPTHTSINLQIPSGCRDNEVRRAFSTGEADGVGRALRRARRAAQAGAH